ncbi:hypothetical protein [Caldilinea sp.]|uniref:hypothetical protein n=1 Tax=Caldilinea sp. TaxID=2293560 RepID=UPI002CA0BA5F|nr:hypothetical protein [Anaerolineales bacterium]HQY92436.1 hypothetical protein [Caldilinea sp.]HRA65084.1 hypothetical protein [Caldilinea sp.]
MQQAKFSLTPGLSEFVASYAAYGFKDKSSMVQTALLKLKEEIERKELRESAELYATVYEEEADLRELTESAIQGWPE